MTHDLVRPFGRAGTETGYFDEFFFQLGRSFRRTFLPNQHRMDSAHVGSGNLLVFVGGYAGRPADYIALLLTPLRRLTVRIRDRWPIVEFGLAGVSTLLLLVRVDLRPNQKPDKLDGFLKMSGMS